MKQYTGNQYDDDLTLGTEEYDDSYYTGNVDFFEFSTDDESPISRLKSLILSIDWEITDEILIQFNEELLDLRAIWADQKINLVYVQALEKISNYIYQKKANSHPSAIKLLLTLYHNLEKIVSSEDLTEAQKKAILLEDVNRFESLKRHIGQHNQAEGEHIQTEKPTQQTETADNSPEQDLLALKATVLGIDWEITDDDLNSLRQEVMRLEEKFADSKPKIILLQGIGTLAAYIKLKKSNAHADAFKLLHLFYESLEKMVLVPRSLNEEKKILFPAVEKFNAFKSQLGSTITTEAISRDESEMEEVEESSGSITVAPAFADLPEEDVKGFQAEEEAEALGLDNSGKIDTQVDSFFKGEGFKALETEANPGILTASEKELQELALQGVNVEIDDEDDIDASSYSTGSPAPALCDASEPEDEAAMFPAALTEESTGMEDETGEDVIEESPADNPVDDSTEVIAAREKSGKNEVDFSQLDRDLVLQGVNVETEADDDSDEEALPLMGGELAPALADNDETSIFNASIFEDSSSEIEIEEEIAGTLGGFFDEEISSHESLSASDEGEDDRGAEQTEDEPSGWDEPAPAGDLAFETEPAEQPAALPADEIKEENDGALDQQLDNFFGLEQEPAASEETEPFSEPLAVTEDAPVAFEETALPASLENEENEEEVVFELAEDDTAEIYQPLQSCVEALGIELDDKVFVSLWHEMNSLQESLKDKALEKTFLQLLSTVARHIDQHRYDASAAAHSLLQAICTTLASLPTSDLQRRHEMLLSETTKVLQWQEQLMQQLVATSEAALTVDTEDEELLTGEDFFDEQEPETQGATLHEEISSLKQTLQDEIAELRKERKAS